MIYLDSAVYLDVRTEARGAGCPHQDCRRGLSLKRLGIVYTPVEVVDFIVNSADHVVRQEFGRSLSDEGVHVLDPFTGTGIFLVRLLQSALIRDTDLKRKYHGELHANELVLLAYYIAAIHIEEAFHGRRGPDSAYALCLLFIHPHAPNLINLRSASTMPA